MLKHVWRNYRSLTAEEFIHMDQSEVDSEPTIERDLGAFLSAGVLTLRNPFLPRMDSPVANKKTDTLKQAMNNLAATKGNFCFLIDEFQQVQGVVTLRDMIIQFAPPSGFYDRRRWFFLLALEQTGCHIEKGTMICDHWWHVGFSDFKPISWCIAFGIDQVKCDSVTRLSMYG